MGSERTVRGVVELMVEPGLGDPEALNRPAAYFDLTFE